MGLKEIRKKLKWLDPFTYVDLYLMPKVNPGKSETISWIVYLLSAFVFAFLIYTALGFVLGTESPMMIVVSSSMEPLYHRGDVIILQGTSSENIQAQEVALNDSSLKQAPFSSFASAIYSSKGIESIEFNSGQTIPITQEGSIVVYQSTHLYESIVHRAVAKISAKDGLFLLTKGDSVNNTTIDQDCGVVYAGHAEKPCIELYPIPIEELQGKSVLWIPLIGCAKLWLLDDLTSLIRTGELPKEIMPGNIC